jgi:DNA-binding response OmpR family regulator
MTNEGGIGPVLLVEDDQALADMLNRYLTARGYDMQVVGSEEAAESALGSGFRPGVVILDLNLPGQTGWSLLRSAQLSAAGSPPVLIATATPVSPSKLRELGAAGYLPKPFPLETLRTTVERMLAGTGEES